MEIPAPEETFGRRGGRRAAAGGSPCRPPFGRRTAFGQASASHLRPRRTARRSACLRPAGGFTPGGVRAAVRDGPCGGLRRRGRRLAAAPAGGPGVVRRRGWGDRKR